MKWCPRRLDSAARSRSGRPTRPRKSAIRSTAKFAWACPQGSPNLPPSPSSTSPIPGPWCAPKPTAAPMLLAGNGQGVVEAASAGLLSGDPTILYSASSRTTPADSSRPWLTAPPWC